jgi:hypothetical protein
LATIAGVGLAHHKYGGHCGLYYAIGDDGVLELLHLKYHEELVSEPPSEYYEDIDSRYPDRERAAVSDFCRAVLAKHGLRGFRFSAARTDAFASDTAELKLDEPGTGFTCATFIKAIFDKVKLPLVVAKSWPPATDQDRSWLQLHADFIANAEGKNDPQHGSAIDVSCSWSRFLPEHIAAAAAVAPPAAKYRQIAKDAELLMRRVVATRPALKLDGESENHDTTGEGPTA